MNIKKTLKIIRIIGCLTFNFSCISTVNTYTADRLIKENNIDVKKEFAEEDINGIYQGNSANAYFNSWFYFDDLKTYPFYFKKEKYERSFLNVFSNIKIAVTDGKKMSITLLLGDIEMDTITFKGRFYKNYFLINKDVFIPLPPLVFIIRDSDLLITLTNDNQLAIIDKSSIFGMILLFSGGKNDVSVYKYKKLE